MEPLFVLAGPTAVGKTALSLRVAHALQAEILNVDSRQLYRAMNIGTAKPTVAQQAIVRHHLLDLLAPHQPTSAAQFATAARAVLDDLARRHVRALLVAGSGLYLQAILYGLMAVPAAHPPLRQALQRYATHYGLGALHRRLHHIDPCAAAWYHPRDGVRIVRALEVFYLTGVPFSVHQRRHARHEPVYPYIGIGLTRDRSDLYARIDQRTEAMLAGGWLAEVEHLVAQGYGSTCTAMNSLGYRELLAYHHGACSWEHTVAAIQTATRRFAKRQLTWFRKFPGLRWINLSGLDDGTAAARVLCALHGYHSPHTYDTDLPTLSERCKR